MKEKELYLPLKEKWYRMIEAGVKTEEYRELTPYWAKRLLWRMLPTDKDGAYEPWTISGQEAIWLTEHPRALCARMQAGELVAAGFTHVRFALGYPKRGDQSRHMVRRIREIAIGHGRPEWGAEPEKEYFIIKLEE